MEDSNSTIPSSTISNVNLPDSLIQLMEYQLSLDEMVGQEKSRFTEFTQPLDIESLIAQATHYLSKMTNVKKDMDTLAERAERIKKRALRLQEIIQKQTLEKEMRKDQQLQREKQLAPVILGKSTKSRSD